MTKFLIVYGHGAGDPGAVGNGTNERDFNRKVLHPYLAKWASKSKHSFEFYDTSGGKDLYQATAAGGGMYSIGASTYGSITEIHEDAASASATGGHVIVSNKFKADKNDLALAQVIKKYVGWWGSVANSSGISYRNDLANMNVAAQRGINYRLMELGFITSAKDMNNIKNNLDGIAKGIIEGITGESLGSVATVAKPITHKKKARHNVRVYWFAAKNDAGLAKLKAYCKTQNMSNKEVKGKDGRIMLEIKYFDQWDANKRNLTKFIEDSDWNYDVVLEQK